MKKKILKKNMQSFKNKRILQERKISWFWSNLIRSDPTYVHNLIRSDPTYVHNLIRSDPTYVHNLIRSDPTYVHNLIRSDPTYVHYHVRFTTVTAVLILRIHDQTTVVINWTCFSINKGSLFPFTANLENKQKLFLNLNLSFRIFEIKRKYLWRKTPNFTQETICSEIKKIVLLKKKMFFKCVSD